MRPSGNGRARCASKWSVSLSTVTFSEICIEGESQRDRHAERQRQLAARQNGTPCSVPALSLSCSLSPFLPLFLSPTLPFVSVKLPALAISHSPFCLCVAASLSVSLCTWLSLSLSLTLYLPGGRERASESERERERARAREKERERDPKRWQQTSPTLHQHFYKLMCRAARLARCRSAGFRSVTSSA